MIHPVLVLPRSGVIPPDNKVGGTKVFSNDGVPHRFSRSSHSHRQGKESERGHSVGVGSDDGFVDTHSGEGVDISRFGCRTHNQVSFLLGDDGMDDFDGLSPTTG